MTTGDDSTQGKASNAAAAAHLPTGPVAASEGGAPGPAHPRRRSKVLSWVLITFTALVTFMTALVIIFFDMPLVIFLALTVLVVVGIGVLVYLIRTRPKKPQPDNPTVEHWFHRRGLLSLLRGTPEARPTSQRAAPSLVIVFLFVMITLPWSTDLPLLGAVAISVGSTVVVWVGANLYRHRPLFAAIERFGWPECAAFVGVPTLVTAVSAPEVDLTDPDFADLTHLNLWMAAGMAIVMSAILVLVLFAYRIGLWSLITWMGRTTLRGLRQSGATLASSLPVSLGVVFFFFVSPGVWVSFGMLPKVAYFSVIALLLTLAGIFLGSQRHFGMDSVASFDTQEDLAGSLEGTPLEGASVDVATPASAPLSREQRANVKLVAVMSQLVVGGVIALAVFLLFIVIGYLAVDMNAVNAWTKLEPPILVTYTGLAHTYVLTMAHVKVAGFLATFSAFNYSLASATDARLRQGAKDSIAHVIRQGCAMRLLLLPGTVHNPPEAEWELPTAPETDA